MSTKRLKDEILVAEILLAIHDILHKYKKLLKLKQANRVISKFNLKIGMTYGNQTK